MFKTQYYTLYIVLFMVFPKTMDFWKQLHKT